MANAIASRGLTVAAVSFFALVAAGLATRTWHLLNEPGQPDPAEWGMHDFRDAVYYPVVATLQGDNPYDTPAFAEKYPVGQWFPLYSPLTLLIHAPFGLLSHRAAELAYFAMMLVLVVVLAATVLRFAGLAPGWTRTFALAGLLLMSRPGHMNLVVANVTLQAVLLSFVALHSARSRPILAGVAVGLATFKPTFGIPLMGLMLARGDHRAVAIGAAVAIVATLPVTALLAHHAGGVGPLIDSIVENHFAGPVLPGIGEVRESWARLDASAVAVHVFGSTSVARYGLPVACLALATGVAWRRRHSAEDERADGPLGGLICLAVLAGIYHQAYDAMLLTIPLLAVAVAARSEYRGAPWRRWLLTAALAVPQLNYVATATAISALQLQSGTWAWAAVVSANGLAILVAMLVMTSLATPPAKTTPGVVLAG